MSIKDKSANDAARYLLLAFVFLAMLPLGSNRPFFWSLSAFTVGLLALFFIRSQYVGGLALANKSFFLKLALALFMVYTAYLLFQLLPIGTNFLGGLNAPVPVNLDSKTLSIAPGETWFALLRWATYGVLFVLVFQLSARSKSSGMMLFGLSMIAGLQAIYALAALFQLNDTILFFDKESYFGVATGTFVNRNSLATFLSLGAVVSAVLVTVDDSTESRFAIGSGHRLFAAIFLAFIVAALFATNSRMGLFAGVAGLLTAIFLRMQSWKHIGLTILLAVLAGAAGFYLYGFKLIDRIIRVEGAFDGRMELYNNIWAMIYARPLTGYGGGAFAQAYLLFHEPSAQSAVTWDHAHSTYLALWSGAGFVFGSLPILILLCLAAGSLKRSRARKGFSPEGAVLIGASVTVAIHSLVDFSLEMQAVAIFYTVILAIGCSRAHQYAFEEKAD